MQIHRTGKLQYPALRGVDLTIEAGEVVAVVGPSGSGKTMIMNMITGIDRPTAGSVVVDGQQIDELCEEQFGFLAGALPEAGHVGGLQPRPEEYERRVTGFFDRHSGEQDRLAQLEGRPAPALQRARRTLGFACTAD